jgi:hypothetical protein
MLIGLIQCVMYLDTTGGLSKLFSQPTAVLAQVCGPTHIKRGNSSTDFPKMISRVAPHHPTQRLLGAAFEPNLYCDVVWRRCPACLNSFRKDSGPQLCSRHSVQPY